ncbi:M4 family metallopeptidase [uncultured Lacinutrix sp.]|uniref:M4 family metallopeptidase n=1 Tax=uncultured Lacinutrix sp. TaxID=574032 RepID=UPI00260D8C6B|nr:M4 family metallopeptidase [uncultured Lacinutrix sp.]
MKIYNNLLFYALFITSFSYSQSTERAILEFQEKSNAAITINENSKIPEFIKFPTTQALKLNGTSTTEKAISFLNNYKSIYKIEDINNSFKAGEIEIDNIGLQRVVLNQEYNGVPVYDGKLLFHFNIENNLTSVNGNFIPNIKLNAQPSIEKTVANGIALQTIENQNINFSGETLFVHNSKLYVFNKGLAQGVKGANYLVYEVEVRNEIDVREFVFVNAHNGTIVEQFTGIAHALDRIVYEGNTGNTVWQEGDALPGTLTIWQQNEVEASAHVYNFFVNAFGYVSYDGADAQMRTINNNPNINCPNANWNGATANYCNGTASDDVIAHEWGHAYTEYTSGLIYQWQSGAINESYSDIWGETVDLLNNYEDADDDNSIRTAGCGSSDRWRMGEDATAFGGAIRDMWNPPCNGDPGKVTDGEYLCGTADNGGVHINSGIPNHAYALLVDGGAYNGQTITGIGFTKAAHIFWRAQSQYLTNTSDFNNLADALEASANDLIGVNLEGLSTTSIAAGPSGEIISASDVQQVINAILAVEMRINPDVCGYTALLGDSPALCDNAINSPIFFEDWETGMDGWTVTQSPASLLTWESRDWVVSGDLPNNRPGSAAFGIDPINGNCTSDFENGIITIESPVITMPDFTEGNYEIAFDHYVSTEANWDGGNIKASIDGGAWTLIPTVAFTTNGYNATLNDTAAGNDNPMEGQDAFTGSDEGSNKGSWGTSIINLNSIGVVANSTIQFRFEMGTDGCNGREGWYVDDLRVYNCAYALSISDFDSINNLVKIYPNPSKGIFNLKKTNQIDLIKAEVYDINGRFIKTIDLSNVVEETTIDLSNIASGLYFMTLTSKETKSVIKLIKE